MLALLQRVSSAEVIIEGQSVATIDSGLLVFCGFQPDDDADKCQDLLQKILKYRLFSDEADKMNLSLKDTQGGLLLVPQFTLAANTNTGLRPSFSSAAPPALGAELFDNLCAYARDLYQTVQCGQFGAHMQIKLINDGPATFLLRN